MADAAHGVAAPGIERRHRSRRFDAPGRGERYQYRERARARPAGLRAGSRALAAGGLLGCAALRDHPHVDGPIAYLITFRTYGTWLPGDSRGSTDRQHSGYGEPWLGADALRESVARAVMTSTAVVLAAGERALVTAAITDACAFRGWTLHALNVRTNHVHAVVSASQRPEKVMSALKARATVSLREAGLRVGTPVWSRHGSTVHLWNEQAVLDAAWYVNHQQGAREVPRETG